MSDIGLNSMIYDISSKHLEILSRFLVEANYNPLTVQPKLVTEVHALLRQLSEPTRRNFQIQMVDQIIESYLQKNSVGEKSEEFLKKLLNYFDKSASTEKDALRRIAILTEALDKECDESYSRIRTGK